MSRPISLSFAALIAVIIVQLAVPAIRISQHEAALADGNLYRFKIRFYDPHDPMQGRYIQLRYDVDYPKYTQIHPDSRYAVLAATEDGFARFTEIRMDKPDDSGDYMEIHVEYGDPRPWCDRFYLKETLAPEAEQIFLQKLAESDTPVWADIRVRNGHAVIETIRVNGVPLQEAMRASGGGE